MKLFFNKRFIKSIAIVLIALLCFIQPASDYVNSGGTVKAAGTGTTSDTDESDQDATADSEATTSELPEDLNYVSEVRLFQGTSYETAKKAATEAGYIIAGSDMNSGTEKGDWGDFWADRGSGDSVVLGYKTTKDRADAITSMKMAEMDTGYQTFDYEEIEKSMNTGMNILAEDIIAALADFASGVFGFEVVKNILDKILTPILPCKWGIVEDTLDYAQCHLVGVLLTIFLQAGVVMAKFSVQEVILPLIVSSIGCTELLRFGTTMLVNHLIFMLFRPQGSCLCIICLLMTKCRL